MAAADGQFRRINFFRGFLTTESDWNDAEAYHIDKRRLHNRTCHSPGVFPHVGGGLLVSSRGRTEMAVEVAPGYAIDGRGNDIWVPSPEIKVLNPKDFKLPQVVYLVLRYIEEPTDYVAYKENPEFKGHKRIEEKYKLEWTNLEPDPEREVEIARVSLSRAVKRLADAKDSKAPANNEIDLRFVPQAGVAGAFIQPTDVQRIRRMLKFSRLTYSFLLHDLEIRRAGDVLYSMMNMEMLLLTGKLSRSDFVGLSELVLELQQEMVEELDSLHPQHASSREFLNFKNQVRYLQQMLSESGEDSELMNNIIGFQTKACEALETLHERRLERSSPQKVDEISPEKLWEQIKERSKAFGKELTLNKKKFKLVDTIDILDRDSEGSHGFEVVEYHDMYRSRQNFKYPDGEQGVAVKDQGIAFEGGHCVFKIGKCKLKRQLVLVFRIDYTHGEWSANMVVNGKKADAWKVDGRDRKFRWRNWPYVVPADMVVEDQMEIRIEFDKAERDINLFHVWAYQPV